MKNVFKFMCYAIIMTVVVMLFVSCDNGTKTATDNDEPADVGDTMSDIDQTPDVGDTMLDNDETSDDDVSETKEWTKQWGTTENDFGVSVAVDSNGNIFVTGHTKGSLDGNTSAGEDDDDDIFLTKWNSDGTKAWTKQWGTNEDDVGTSIAVDRSDNIYVAGYTEGSLDGNSSVGNLDAFLTKWNADGTKEWTKQWGTSEYDTGHSVIVDSSGNIFVTGYTRGSLDGNSEQGGDDIFLAKWNSDGTKAWTKQWGTSEDDRGYSVSVDSNSNVFVTGWTYGAIDGNNSAGNVDVFLTKWDLDGTRAWTKQWGTDRIESGHSIAVDNNDNIFVTGLTSGDLDGNKSNGGTDIFLTKWNSDGTKEWTKQWGSLDDDDGSSVAVDSSGNIFVTGGDEEYFDGNDSLGGSDIFLTKFNEDGSEEWTELWGTSGNDEGSSVAVDSSGNIFVTGIIFSAGSVDVFLTKWKSEI